MTLNEYNISVDKYSDGIFRFILKNIRNEEKAKDIVQDTYEKLWVRIENVSNDKVKSYLFTTAYHTMIDVIRKDKRMVDLEYADFGSMSFEERNFDVKTIIDKAVDRLPEKQKTVILLRDYEGYSYKEIADVTGLNESQVKVYIYRARVFLKEQLVSVDQLV